MVKRLPVHAVGGINRYTCRLNGRGSGSGGRCCWVVRSLPQWRACKRRPGWPPMTHKCGLCSATVGYFSSPLWHPLTPRARPSFSFVHSLLSPTSHRTIAHPASTLPPPITRATFTSLAPSLAPKAPTFVRFHVHPYARASWHLRLPLRSRLMAPAFTPTLAPHGTCVYPDTCTSWHLRLPRHLRLVAPIIVHPQHPTRRASSGYPAPRTCL
jgi:hypothetical protein